MKLIEHVYSMPGMSQIQGIYLNAKIVTDFFYNLKNRLKIKKF